jgi:hypothetical protein
MVMGFIYLVGMGIFSWSGVMLSNEIESSMKSGLNAEKLYYVVHLTRNAT